MKQTTPLLLIVSVLCFSCSSGKQTTSNGAIQILKATSQLWSGGTAPGSSGVNYKMLIEVQRQGVNFDSLWVDDHRLPLAPKFRPNKYPQPPFDRGDTVLVQARLISGKTAKLSGQEKKEFKGEGLLSYKLDKTPYYLEIDTFKSLPKLRHP